MSDAPRPVALPAPEQLHALLDRVLDTAVEEIAGVGATARPEQRRLSHDILTTMLERGHLSGQAPTGSGKSLAGLAPAMLLSVLGERRSVFSTESLRLQRQYLDKDAPLVARAVAAVTGKAAPSAAVLKGRSNYVCAAKVASFLSGVDGLEVTEPEALAKASWRGSRGLDGPDLQTLVIWGRDQIVDDQPGEKDDQPVSSSGQWHQVSVSAEECTGRRCPFQSVCRADAARGRAAAAAVVVTNHSLVALQVVTEATIVMGGAAGIFDHLVVDEAHALPSSVRSHGATSLGASTLRRCVSSLKGLMTPGPALSRLAEPAEALALELEATLAALLGGADTRPLRGGEEGLNQLCGRIAQWAATTIDALPEVPETSVQGQLQHQRATAALAKLLTVAATEGSVPGLARWIEAGENGAFAGPVLRSGQADTAGRLAGAYAAASIADDAPLAVVAVSATLPETVTGDLGLSGAHHRYASPFSDAYSASAAGVPRPGRGDRLFADRRMDLDRHREWAAELIARFVGAAGGSALVLGATTASARRYLEVLAPVAEDLDIALYSQWDGSGDVVSTWRSDERGVLVGTKGLMTGVDAAGATCRLVIIDRVPRAPGNPLDDARVALARQQRGLNGYEAQSAVYGGDAALLLAQAAGRLIRSAADRGTAVVLDPRLLKGATGAYADPVRRLYTAALAPFGAKLDDPDAICARLRTEHLAASSASEALALAS